MRRRVLGALIGTVALALAGIGGAVAIQRAHPSAPQEVAVRVVVGDAPLEVATPSTPLPTTSVPTTPAPATTSTTTTKARAVSTTVPLPAPTSRPPIPPRPTRITGSTVAPRVIPTTVPFVAHPRHCTATPSTVEVAYRQWVPVHVSFNLDMYAGARVALRDGGPEAVPSLAAWSTVDATGRGADFLVGVNEPRTVNGVLEPAGTPHTFYMDDMDCSVRVIPH